MLRISLVAVVLGFLATALFLLAARTAQFGYGASGEYTMLGLWLYRTAWLALLAALPLQLRAASRRL